MDSRARSLHAGKRSTGIRNGSTRILRKVTACRAVSRGVIGSSTEMANSRRRYPPVRRPRREVISSAGNCHRCENKAPSPLAWRTSKVRPCGSSSTAAASVTCDGGALASRGAGICSAMPSVRARHQRRHGTFLAAGRFRRANRRAQFHHGLVPVAGSLRGRANLRRRSRAAATARARADRRAPRPAAPARAPHCRRARQAASP